MIAQGGKILIGTAEVLLLVGTFILGEEFAPYLKLEHRVQKEFAWIQFTYNYSEHQWCVNAQKRSAAPGEQVGGCWASLHEAEKGILEK